MSDYYYDMSVLGGTVILVRTRFDGDVVYEKMPGMLAAMAAMDDEDNGVIYQSSRIVFGDVIDVWGGSI